MNGLLGFHCKDWQKTRTSIDAFPAVATDKSNKMKHDEVHCLVAVFLWKNGKTFGNGRNSVLHGQKNALGLNPGHFARCLQMNL